MTFPNLSPSCSPGCPSERPRGRSPKLRRPWRALLLAAALFVPGSLASAQGSLPIQVTELEGPIGTRQGIENINRGLNALDCENPSDSFIEITLLPGSQAMDAVDLWAGIGTERCLTKNSRTPPTATCRYIGFVQMGTSVGSAPPPNPSTIRVGLDAIPRDDGFPFCASTSPSTVNLLAVADTQNFLDETSALPAEDWTSLEVKVDAGPPATPEIRSATSSGDRQIAVEWGRVIEAQLVLYKVYVELGGCDGAAGTLVPGEPPPLEVDGETVFRLGDQVQGEKFSVRTAAIGLEVGESAAVYVTSMDMALNESALSEPICITRVATAGFCEAWENSEGEPCPSSCSTLGAGPAAGQWLTTLLALLAYFVLRRRATASR